MSLPSFLRGIIDKFKKDKVDSDDYIQAEEAEKPWGRGGWSPAASTTLGTTCSSTSKLAQVKGKLIRC